MPSTRWLLVNWQECSEARSRRSPSARSGEGSIVGPVFDRYGFPRAYLPRRKMVAGFITGDRVKAVVPAPLKTAGVHVGRIAVRTSGSCAIRTSTSTIDGINIRYISLIQRADGYAYRSASDLARDHKSLPPASPKGTPASSPG